MSWKKCIDFWASFSVCPDPVASHWTALGETDGMRVRLGLRAVLTSCVAHFEVRRPLRPTVFVSVLFVRTSFFIMIACARTLCWFSPLDMRVQLCSHVRLIFVPSGATTAFSLLPERPCGKISKK